MPNDGEFLNVASLRQNEKALADFIAYLADPFAIPNAWAQRTARWLNARGQERAIIDHMGYLSGRVAQWQEQWSGSEFQVGSGVAILSRTTMDWLLDVVSTASGQMAVSDPNSTVSVRMRHLLVTLGTGGGDLCRLNASNKSVSDNNTGIAMEWDLYTSTAIDQMHVAIGMAFAVTNIAGPTAGFTGAMFYKGNANANWMFVTGDGTALSTPIDTGVTVAANNDYPMRVEWLGSGISDDSIAAARGYINGSLVATITTNLPSAPAPPNNMVGPVLNMSRDTGSAVRTIRLGPVRWSANY